MGYENNVVGYENNVVGYGFIPLGCEINAVRCNELCPFKTDDASKNAKKFAFSLVLR